MINLPDLALAVKFSLNSKLIVSLPVPVALEVKIIQLESLTVVHSHPGFALRLTFPAPPAIEKKLLADERE